MKKSLLFILGIFLFLSLSLIEIIPDTEKITVKVVEEYFINSQYIIKILTIEDTYYIQVTGSTTLALSLAIEKDSKITIPKNSLNSKIISLNSYFIKVE